MPSSALRVLAGAALLAVAQVGVCSAQTTYPSVKLSGRLHEQLYWFDNEAYAARTGPRSTAFIRRARIEARGQIAENVSFHIQPSFEAGRTLNATTTCTSTEVPEEGGTPTLTCRTTGRSGLRLRDAYIEVRLGPGSGATRVFLLGGQEKRPMSRYELLSSNNLPSIERGGGQGLLPLASNDLFSSAGFLAHDVGASLRLEHELGEDRRATVKLGVYNGQGESLNDVNDRKSYGARGTFALTRKLDVGASWFVHDGIVTTGAVTDSGFTNSAWNLDAQWGEPGGPGWFLLGEYLQGRAASAAEPTMRGFQTVAAYHVRLEEGSWLHGIEPALRFDVADPDTDADDDRVTTLTAVVGLYLTDKAWFRIAYERQGFQADDSDSISGMRSMLAVSF